jgi:hypothetical protein
VAARASGLDEPPFTLVERMRTVPADWAAAGGVVERGIATNQIAAMATQNPTDAIPRLRFPDIARRTVPK